MPREIRNRELLTKQTGVWLIDPPTPFARIEVIEQWLCDTRLAIEEASDQSEREALQAAYDDVYEQLLKRKARSTLSRRMGMDQP